MTRTFVLASAPAQVTPSGPPPHGPADPSPRVAVSPPATADETRIDLPLTAPPKLRMYCPAPGFAASVMPPDWLTIPPSARTTAHLTATPLPVPEGPAGPCGPAGPAGPCGPRGSCPAFKS